ncbi:MAG: ATP-dependent 6-phosphofructokinase [Alphaproteobacteria bacterium]|nr:ATP-dependent 6-phosphofructokinase [Alphaproteobacteria bacterium]
MSEIKKIGILTSGGDCSGLNVAISGVVKAATLKGWTVYGIHNGTEGLTERPLSYEILTLQNFSDTPWSKTAGSYLGSLNKGIKADQMDAVAERFGQGARELGLDAVVVLGGDGSMNVLKHYCTKAGIKMIGIPKTIDNDTPLTDFSIGFETACQVCMEAVDSIDSTARSHHRAMIIEMMGRDAGHLALQSAIAGYADVCLIPEIPYTLDGIINKLEAVKATGRTHAIIVVSEGIKTETGEVLSAAKNMVGEKVHGGIGDYLTNLLNQKYGGFQIRCTRLGHIQRSGHPVFADRIMASVFAAKAVELLDEGKTNVMVGLSHGEVTSYPLEEVVAAGTKSVDLNSSYIKAAKLLGMYIGEI